MIPKPLTLRKEDYKESPDWTVRLFQQLNDWFGPATQVLTRGLRRSENLLSTVKVITFTTKTPAADTFPLTVKHDLGQRPTDAWIGDLRKTNNGAITAVWSFTADLDQDGNLLARFQGLEDATAYAARVVIE
jgi:hypothetical protein